MKMQVTIGQVARNTLHTKRSSAAEAGGEDEDVMIKRANLAEAR